MRGLRAWGTLLVALAATGCLDFSEERFCEGADSPYGALCRLEGLAFAATSPTSGPLSGGTRVLLQGTGFEKDVTVTVGGRPAAQVVVHSALSLEVVLPPADAAGPATLTVRQGAQEATLPTPFTYWALPEVTAVVPEAAREGSEVVLLGSGFEPGRTVVYFGESGVQAEVVDARTARALVPANGNAAARVVVRAEREGTSGPPGPTFIYGGWRRASLPGGLLTAAAWGADGTAFVGGLRALFRRLPGESQWRESRAGLLPETSVTALAIPPTPAQRVYAATGVGLYRSDNAGISWWLVKPEAVFQQLLVAGTTLFGRTEGEVLRSADEGLTWTVLYQGTPSSIALAPEGLLIADAGSVATGGVWTWTEQDGAQRTVSGRSTQVAVDAANPGTAYADVDGVLHRASSFGQGWASLGVSLSGPGCLSVSPTGDVYACVQTELQRLQPSSPNLAWETVVTGPRGTGLTFSSAGQGLLTSFGPGLMETSGGGTGTWRLADPSLAAALVTAVVVDPEDSHSAFALVSGMGLFHTMDGETWSQVKTSVDLSGTVRLVLTLATGGQRRLSALTPTSVVQSTDDGSSWNEIARPPSAVGFASDRLFVVPETGSLYLASSRQLHRFSPTTNAWDLLYEVPAASSELLHDVAVRAEEGQEYIFLSSTHGVRTRPLSIDWQLMLPLDGLTPDTALAVGMDANRPYVVVGAGEGLYRAAGTDGLVAVTQEFGGRFGRMYAQGPYVLAASTSSGLLLRSSDAGRTWSRVPPGLGAADVRGVAFSAAQPQRAYAATIGGLFVTDTAWY